MTPDPRGAENRTQSGLFASLRAQVSTATLDEHEKPEGDG
jgi:hypothetical protein